MDRQTDNGRQQRLQLLKESLVKNWLKLAVWTNLQILTIQDNESVDRLTNLRISADWIAKQEVDSTFREYA